MDGILTTISSLLAYVNIDMVPLLVIDNLRPFSPGIYNGKERSNSEKTLDESRGHEVRCQRRTPSLGTALAECISLLKGKNITGKDSERDNQNLLHNTGTRKSIERRKQYRPRAQQLNNVTLPNPPPHSEMNSIPPTLRRVMSLNSTEHVFHGNAQQHV